MATDSGWNSLTYDGQKLVDVRDAWERQQRQQQQQYVRQTQIQQEGASALGFIDAAAAESGGLHLRGGGGDTAKVRAFPQCRAIAPVSSVICSVCFTLWLLGALSNRMQITAPLSHSKRSKS